MRNSFIILAAGLLFSGAAMACPGVESCNSSACAMIPSPPPMSEDLEGASLSFSVTGLRCGNCSSKVMMKLNDISGVAGSQVDHATGAGTVIYDDEVTTAEALVSAINELGYAATIVSVQPSDITE